jgi:hypothetical protein
VRSMAVRCPAGGGCAYEKGHDGAGCPSPQDHSDYGDDPGEHSGDDCASTAAISSWPPSAGHYSYERLAFRGIWPSPIFFANADRCAA